MLKISFLLATAATACLASFVSVSPYTGQHSQKCGYGSMISGAKVNNKLYTMGGCYTIPYIVDPDTEDATDMLFRVSNFMGTSSSVNVSDTMQIYDFVKDTWTDETAKTPLPWRKAELQAVNDKYIFAHSAYTRPASSAIAFWKYDIETKEWSQLSDLPFLWHDTLRSCAKGDNIYFGGSGDGAQQNIIHVYDTKSQEWKKPIYLSKKMVGVKDLLCGEEHIHFFAQEAKDMDLDNVSWDSFDFSGESKKETYFVFSADYLTGLTTVSPNVTGNYGGIGHQDNAFYLYDVAKNQSVVSKLQVEPFKQYILETLPYNLDVPLIVPYGEEVYFFGGGEKTNFGFAKKGAHGNEIKKYNHKLIVDNEQVLATSLANPNEHHEDADDSGKFLRQE